MDKPKEMEDCRYCNGKGYREEVPGDVVCESCYGTGKSDLIWTSPSSYKVPSPRQMPPDLPPGQERIWKQEHHLLPREDMGDRIRRLLDKKYGIKREG